MANYIASDTDFISVADAIRTKGGTSVSLSFPGGFVDAIEAFPEATTLDNLSVTQNGTYTPSSGHAFGQVSVNVAGAEDGIIERTISGSYINTTTNVIGSAAFQYCSNLTTVNFPACTLIRTNAFDTCSNLTTVSFPACTLIESNAFLGCRNLTTISFPVCTTTRDRAFGECRNLTTVNFPACTLIGTNAFQYCSELTTVSFPVCTTISSFAFQRCYKLLSVYLLNSSVATLSNINAFVSTPISNYTASTGGVNGSIYVRASLLTEWKAATNWVNYSSRFVGLTDVEIAGLEG